MGHLPKRARGRWAKERGKQSWGRAGMGRGCECVRQRWADGERGRDGGYRKTLNRAVRGCESSRCGCRREGRRVALSVPTAGRAGLVVVEANFLCGPKGLLLAAVFKGCTATASRTGMTPEEIWIKVWDERPRRKGESAKGRGRPALGMSIGSGWVDVCWRRSASAERAAGLRCAGALAPEGGAG